jgi:hypothetical protein
MNDNDARYLRDKAVQLRQLAQVYKTDLAETLMKLADEFENKATEIAARSGSAPDRRKSC